MRIVHTSDWHAGRVLRNRQRLPELEAILDHLGSFIEKEQVDLLLMSGDVFDTGAPNADAERVVFRFFKRVGRAGTKTVVIAGNHDNPVRIEAWGTLAELVDVQAIGRPRSLDKGGLLKVDTRSGESAHVAVIPFAGVSQILSALEIAGDDTKSRQRYASVMEDMVADVCRGFQQNGVNLLMAHTHLSGAAFSGSERTVHLGEEWAATPQAIPSRAHYVALGHIHKPQKIDAAPSPTFYAGSPMQLDFGEVGEEKSFVFIEARPRTPARIERVPYQGGRALLRVRGTIADLERDAHKYVGAGYLRVVVPVERPDPDINTKVRRLAFGADVVSVDIEVPEVADQAALSPDFRAARPADLFRGYYRAEHGIDPDDGLVAAFEDLLNSADAAS